MNENLARKRVVMGAKMRQALEYIDLNPGELEYVIRLHFGHRSSKLIERLVAGNMIKVVDGRCYVNSDNGNDWDKHLRKAKADKETSFIRSEVYSMALSVPCTNRQCLAAVGSPCTGLTRYNRPRIGPHYERLIILAYCLDQEISRMSHGNSR